MSDSRTYLRQGRFVVTSIAGESVRAFVPPPLPPEPTIDVLSLLERLSDAERVWWSNCNGHSDRWNIDHHQEISMPRQRREFKPEFKVQVAQMITVQGLTVAQVCRDMSLSQTAVRQWVKQLNAEGQGGPVNAARKARNFDG